MWVAKLIKEDWPITVRISLQKQIHATLKSFTTKVLEYKAEELNLYVFLSDEFLPM